MSEPSEWNRKVIEEFRANGGKVGGEFEGAPLLLLTTTGARSGEPHTTPLMYLAYGDRMIVFGTKAGAPTNPDWYHNVVAHPYATVEVNKKSFYVTATIQEGDEHDRLFGLMEDAFPQFGEYRKATSREIPVVSLRVAGQPPR